MTWTFNDTIFTHEENALPWHFVICGRAALGYSRMLFFQCYPTFRRFDCKVFLNDALRYTGGAPARVMIDNTHGVVLRGSGREMVPVP